jgi:DMSO/TMAO reductase YedYZ molybdopterin-dependent catalytic subunit
MPLDRRTLLRRAGLVAAGLALGGAGALRADRRALARALAQDVDLPGMPSAITPIGQFYVVSKNVLNDPRIDGSRWRLRVTGSVANAFELDLAGVRAFPAVRQYQTLECIDNQVGGDLISTAEWTGVRLADVLQRAGVRESAQRVVFLCEDGYSDSLPLAKALEPTTLLAYEMNGQTLPPQHGYPLRVLAPGLYGIKNPKWVTEIRVVDGDYRGFWQQRGWTNDGTIKTMSRIDVPRPGTVRAEPQRIGGIAFAGTRGIQAVEVSADNGQTWSAATLAPALSELTWVLWTADWVPQGERQTLVVRAWDGTGALQPVEVRPPLPDGASGLHHVTVRIG